MLRFGDTASNREVPVTDVSNPQTSNGAKSTRENLYLFVTVDFDAKSAQTPGRESEGASKVELMRVRFAPWDYIIGTDSFAAIHPPRSALVRR